MLVSLDLEAIEELPPELTGALTFHLPLEVAALQLAGAAEAVIAERVRRRLTEAYAAGLVDPPLYRWAVEHSRSAAEGLLHDDPARRRAAFDSVANLGDGLAGAAFHGLIRLGYGLWRRRPMEVARGLAYLRTRRQVLVGATAVAPAPSGDARPAPLPPADALEGLTVFDLMNIAAGCEDRAALRPWGDQPLTAHRLAAAALALAARNPSSFVAVHAVTGLHGLCELHAAVDGAAALADPAAPVEATPLGPWWVSYATALGTASAVMASYPPEAVPAAPPGLDGPAELLAAAVDSGETHDVKLVLALQRLSAYGVLDADDAHRVARTKLAATECRAH